MAEVSDDAPPAGAGFPMARIGDPTLAGGTIQSGWSSVLVEGLPSSRLGDVVADPLLNGCGEISTHAPGVYVANMPVARQLDRAAPSAGMASAGRPSVLGAGTVNQGEYLAGDREGTYFASNYSIREQTQHMQAEGALVQSQIGDIDSAIDAGQQGLHRQYDSSLLSGNAMLSQSSQGGMSIDAVAQGTVASARYSEAIVSNYGTAQGYVEGRGLTARAIGHGNVGHNPITGDTGVGVGGELFAAGLEGEAQGGFEFPLFGCTFGGTATGSASAASIGAGGGTDIGWDGQNERYRIGARGKLALLLGLGVDLELYGSCASDAPESAAQGGGPAQVADGAGTVLVGDQ